MIQKMNHFIIASDSFKGTLSAKQACDIISKAIYKHLPHAEVDCIPMADGGEGLVSTLLSICGGQTITAKVRGPLWETIEATYGFINKDTAVIEMAACAGLPLVKGRENPLLATTYGVGELIADAVSRGARKIILGLGGSATNDCGIGMAAALGYRFYDCNDAPIEPLATHMGEIVRIEAPEHLPTAMITAACDVSNPLYGPLGATYTFGRQKGVLPEQMQPLDQGLACVAQAIETCLHKRVAVVPGAGAAGGMGAGVLGFLGGTLKSGIELVLDAADFDAHLQSADIVFTGEGKIDGQSVYGKVPVGIGRRAKLAGVPCIALCGAIGEGAEAVYQEGISAVFSSICKTGRFEDIAKTCEDDLYFLADSVMRTLLL